MCFTSNLAKVISSSNTISSLAFISNFGIVTLSDNTPGLVSTLNEKSPLIPSVIVTDKLSITNTLDGIIFLLSTVLS